MSVDFAEGGNQLSFSFVGLQAQIDIDNVKLTKPPSTINLIANGDFSLPNLNKAAFSKFTNQIPGWKGA